MCTYVTDCGAVLICIQYNKPILCPAIWGIAIKNRALYRLNIGGVLIYSVSMLLYYHT